MEIRKIDDQTSLQIKYCRFICIFFMCIVHIPPGLGAVDSMPSYLQAINVFLADILGRASVTALSFISGFLIVHNYANNDNSNYQKWLNVVVNRLKSLIVPMVFWNGAIIVIGFGILAATGVSIQVIDDLEGLDAFQIVFLRLLGFFNGSSSESLNFLHDIFACAFLSPILIWLAKRISWLLVVLLLLIDNTITFQPVVTRGIILVFFGLGIVYCYRFNDFKPIHNIKWLTLALSVAVLVREYWLAFNGVDIFDVPGYQTIKRFAVSAVAIYAAYLLTQTRFNHWIGKLDKSTYFIFLAHNVFFILTWGAWQLFFGKDLELPYIVYFFIVTPAWFVIAILSHQIIAYLPAFLQILITGKPRNSVKKHAIESIKKPA